MTSPFISFPIPTSDFFAAIDRSANAITFGADPTGVADSTSAIQAAIDFAITNNFSDIYIPAGTYKITSPLYLDLPGNLRAHANACGGSASFSLSLRGAKSCGNHEGFATRLNFTFNNAVALWVGQGQGMCVSDLCLTGPGGAYRANQSSAGVGIGYVGCGAASRTRTENVLVENFYTAFLTGANGDGLNDSNTWIKCACFNCAVGFWISETQNFINSMYDCNPSATIGVLCGNGGGAHIHGGNYSATNNQAASVPCAGISSWTASALGNTFSYTFTAGVTPDIYFTGPTGVYNAFVFPTTHFGLVPCKMTAFNSGTNTATFAPLQQWVEFHFGTANVTTTTDLVAEVQANSKVYCCELVTTFSGSNISVVGVHIENDQPPTTLIMSDATFGSDRPNTLKNVFFNTDPGFPSLSPSHSPSDADLARYYVAHSFPFIYAKSVHVLLTDSDLGIHDPVIIDGASPFELARCNNALFNARATGNGGSGQNNFNEQTQLFDAQYFVTSGNSFTPTSDLAPQRAPMKSPHWIFRPAAYAAPAITASQLSTLQGALPAISNSSPADPVPYPLVWGGQVYKLGDFYQASQAKYHFVSAHHYYSLGQNITTTNTPGLSWNYKGQSCAVNLDAGSMKLMRCGMQVILNDGTSDILYLVTGVYPGLGYITVSSSVPDFIGLTSGTKTSIITGTVIKQEAYSITTF